MAANPSIQLGTDGNWAIKEDNLLAYKKDGDRFFNKEFDFTRGSFAMFVDKDGLVKISGLQETNLVQNGDFATSLSGWSNSNNHWQWTSQGAYFPLISTHNPLRQVLTNPVGVKLKITFTLNIVQGTVNFYYKNASNSSVEVQYTQSGTHTLITEPVKQNTDINFSRYGGINTEFYLNNVSAFEIQLDTPRIDFTDDTTGHLLLEPQSTNLMSYSEDFSQWSTLSGSSVDLNYAISPDGTQNASKFNFDGTNNGRVERQILNVINSQPITFSVWLKTLSGTEQVYIGHSHYGLKEVTVTDQWQRYTSSTVATQTYAYPRVRMDSASSVLVWGYQVEQLPYATSYIPTNGSTATRNADVCINSGSAQDFNDSEGVLYAEIAALANDGTFRYLGLDDNTLTANNVSIYYRSNDNRITFRLQSNGTQEIFEHFDVGNVLDFHKVAFKYKSGDSKIYIDGVLKNTYSITSMPLNLKNFSFEQDGGGQNFYGKVKNIKVFKRAMSEGELYLLTVTQYQSYQEMATALNYTL